MTFTYILLHPGFEHLWHTPSFKKEIYLGIAYSPNTSYSGKYRKIIKGLGRRGWSKGGSLKCVREGLWKDICGGGYVEERKMVFSLERRKETQYLG